MAVVLLAPVVINLMLVLEHHLFLFRMIREWERGFVFMICRWSETLLKVEVSVLAPYVLVVVFELLVHRVYISGCEFDSAEVGL